MIRYTYKIKLRDDFTREDGTRAILLQVFLGGHRLRIPLDVYARPEEFDAVKMAVKIPKDNERAGRINSLLAKVKGRVEEMFFEARISGVPLTPETFKEEMDNKPALSDFIVWMEQEIAKEATDKEASTVKTYRTVINWLRKFREKITFADISFEFAQDFDRFLKKGKVDQNGRNKYHRVLRKFVLLAVKKRRRIRNPYEQFKIKDTEIERTWLSVEEVEKLVALYDAQTLGWRLQRSLRHFLFQVVTSVRVSDLKKMSRADIEGDMLIFHPQKTQRLRKIVKVPLSDLAKRLIADSEVKGKDTLFDVPAEQQMNRYLKEIAIAAKIDKEVTTHVGRHTFGFLYLWMGGKVEELREILGHSKIETTMIYTHVDFSKKVAGIKRFDAIFKPK